jgi:hypothetical protein
VSDEHGFAVRACDKDFWEGWRLISESPDDARTYVKQLEQGEAYRLVPAPPEATGGRHFPRGWEECGFTTEGALLPAAFTRSAPPVFSTVETRAFSVSVSRETIETLERILTERETP